MNSHFLLKHEKVRGWLGHINQIGFLLFYMVNY